MDNLSSNWFSKHKFLGYLFLAVVFAAIVVGIYIWKYGNNLEKFPQIVQRDQQDPTADWKTCSNYQFAYEFMYPSDWKFWTAAAPESVLTSDQTCSTESVYLSKNLAWKEPSLKVSVGTDAGNKTLEQYFSAELSFASPPYKPIKATELDGERLVWYSYDSGSEFALYVVHSGKIYQIIADDMSIELLNQILSTFKFTK